MTRSPDRDCSLDRACSFYARDRGWSYVRLAKPTLETAFNNLALSHSLRSKIQSQPSFHNCQLIFSTMTQTLIIQAITLALLAFIAHRLLFQKRNILGPPPGPTPLPLVGNILDLPPKGIPEFRHWLRHKECYGPISSVTVMGHTLVIIHDREAAHHLLEKNTIRTSARPAISYAIQSCGFNNLVPLLQNDAYHRKARKALHQQLGTKPAVARYCGIQDVEARRLLLRALKQPNDLFKHFNIPDLGLVGANTILDPP
ncbi:cytochrome p450 [Hirsutella rhossiliensis]